MILHPAENVGIFSERLFFPKLFPPRHKARRSLSNHTKKRLYTCVYRRFYFRLM